METEAEEEYFSLSDRGIALSDYLFSIPKDQAVSELQLRFGFNHADADVEYHVLKILWEMLKKGNNI